MRTRALLALLVFVWTDVLQNVDGVCFGRTFPCEGLLNSVDCRSYSGCQWSVLAFHCYGNIGTDTRCYGWFDASSCTNNGCIWSTNGSGGGNGDAGATTSTGSKVGIALGVLAAVAGVIIIAYLVFFRRPSDQASPQQGGGNINTQPNPHNHNLHEPQDPETGKMAIVTL